MAAHDAKDQEKLKRRQEAVQKARDLRIDDAIKDLAKTARGREFMWWLLQIGRVGTQPFTSNALTTAFNCGELNVGQQVLARITEVDPAVFVQMQQEQYNGRSSPDDPTTPAGATGGYDSPEFNDDRFLEYGASAGQLGTV